MPENAGDRPGATRTAQAACQPSAQGTGARRCVVCPQHSAAPFTCLCCVHMWIPPSDTALSKCPAAQQQQQQQRCVQPSRGAKPQGDFANTVRVDGWLTAGAAAVQGVEWRGQPLAGTAAGHWLTRMPPRGWQVRCYRDHGNVNISCIPLKWNVSLEMQQYTAQCLTSLVYLLF